MLRFTQMNFNVRPEKDGNYIVLWKPSNTHETISFTTECGWNTHRTDEGDVYNASGMPDEEMARYYGYWLKPYTIGRNYWFDEIETMLDEVKAELSEYEERKLTDDEMERCSQLEELYDRLLDAKDFAEVLR